MAQPNYGSPWRRWLPRWSRAQSLLTILIAAVTADHEEDPRENVAVEAIIMRSRSIRALSRKKLDEMLTVVHVQLGLDKASPEPLDAATLEYIKRRRAKALKRATRAFYNDPNLRAGVFLQALDILRADMTLLQSEERFYKDLAAMLNLADVREYVDLINDKNKH
ncbi:MAG: hypothetical protein AB7Q23_15400 [Hyphomonadaceae bacterium]